MRQQQGRRRRVSPRSLANLRPWKPGTSPNPGGRAKGIVAFLKDQFGEAGESLLTELARIAFNSRVAVRTRVAALTALLDRGWGRPTLPIDLEATTTPLLCILEQDIPSAGLPLKKPAAPESESE